MSNRPITRLNAVLLELDALADIFEREFDWPEEATLLDRAADRVASVRNNLRRFKRETGHLRPQVQAVRHG